MPVGGRGRQVEGGRWAVLNLPDQVLASIVVPRDIANGIVVGVADTGDVPAGPGRRQRNAARDLAAADQPDKVLATIVVPQDVARAVAIEVADALRMPIGSGRRQIDTGRGAIALN